MTDWSGLIRDTSLIISSWAVVFGVDAWRREHRGKRRIDLAEQTLTSFYEAQDSIRSMRSPLSFESEGKSRKQLENETPEQKVARDRANIMFERFERHREVFNKLHATRYQFMALFGRESAKPFADLHKVTSEMLAAASTLANIWADRPERYPPENAKIYLKHSANLN